MISASQAESNMEITSLDMIGDICEHQCVSMKGKVVAVSEIEKVMVKNSGKQEGLLVCRQHSHVQVCSMGGSN